MKYADSEEEPEKLISASDLDALGVVSVCLQSCFTAENHDSLGDEITRLLLNLSQDR